MREMTWLYSSRPVLAATAGAHGLRNVGAALIVVGGLIAVIGFWVARSDPARKAQTLASSTDRAGVAYHLRWPALAAVAAGIVLVAVG